MLSEIRKKKERMSQMFWPRFHVYFMDSCNAQNYDYTERPIVTVLTNVFAIFLLDKWYINYI